MSRFQKVCLIRVQQGDQIIARVYQQSAILIGRSTEAHIGISDPGVSRLHLEISLKHGRLWITDLGSANGSFLNGNRLEAKARVSYNDGDLLQIGSNRINIRIEILEKSFETKEIEDSDLTPEEKDNLLGLVQAAHAEANRILQLIKDQAELASRQAEQKTAQIISQANHKSDEIIISANNESYRIQEDAKRKHSEVVLKAESDAQEAAQSIFRKAEQAVKDGEAKSREIINQANLRAQESYLKGEDEAQRLLNKARQEVQDLRLNWESERELLLQRAEAEQQDLIEEARAQANQLIANADKQKLLILEDANKQFEIAKAEAVERSAQYYRQAEMELKASQKRAQENLIASQTEAQRVLARAREEAAETKQNIIEKAELVAQSQVDEALARIQQEKRDTVDLVENLKIEHAKITELIEVQEIRLKQLLGESAIQQKNLNNIIDDVKDRSGALDEIQKVLAVIESERSSAALTLQNTQTELSSAIEKRRVAIMEADHIKQDLERQKSVVQIEMKELQDSTRKMVEDYRSREFEALDRMKLEEIQRLKEFKVEADRALNKHRSELANELLQLTEAHIVTMVKPALPTSFNWTQVTEKMQSEIKATLEEMIYKFSQAHGQSDAESIINKKASKAVKNFKLLGSSVAAIIVLLFLIPPTREIIMSVLQKSSVNQAAEDFSKQMSEERNRRYVPPKAIKWYESYTDSILFSEGYVDMKLSSDGQDKWIKDLHGFLYGKLRVDEDSIVNLVSKEAALITKLKEQADLIHPDYVQDQTKKMKELERESVEEMIKVIGSDHKFEKFKKYSEDYYYSEIQKRSPAQKR